MKVEYIIKYLDKTEIKLIVRSFLNCTPFYSIPINSTVFGSFLVDLNTSECSINISDVKNKCFMIRISTDKAVIMELTHSFF